MLQIAVCVDEASVCNALEQWIKQEVLSCEVTVFRKPLEILESRKYFDILFLEADGQGHDSFHVAETVKRQSGTLVILIGSEKEQVFEAFDVEAFHYLLKPLEEEKVKQVFLRAVEKKREWKDKEPLIIRVERSYYHIRKEQILYIENVGRKVVLHMKSKEIAYYAKMNELEEVLGSRFFRCHRGYFVNFTAVKSYEAGSILLKNGETILMAKQKYNDFSAAYAEFLHRKKE